MSVSLSESSALATAAAEVERLRASCSKDYVAHVQDVLREYYATKLEIQTLREKGQPGGIRYDKISVSTTPNIWAICDAAIDNIERKALLDERLAQLEEERREAFEIFYAMKSAEATYFRLNIWMGMSQRDIAKYLAISESTVQRGIEKAFVELYDYIPLEYRYPTQPAI